MGRWRTGSCPVSTRDGFTDAHGVTWVRANEPQAPAADTTEINVPSGVITVSFEITEQQADRIRAAFEPDPRSQVGVIARAIRGSATDDFDKLSAENKIYLYDTAARVVDALVLMNMLKP